MSKGMWQVVALVVGCLSLLLGQALAEPQAVQGPQPSKVASLKAKPGTCQLPPNISSLPAAIGKRASQEDPLTIGRIAALSRPGSTPTLPPRPDLTPKASTKTPINMTTFGRLPLAFIENQGQVNEQAKFYVRTGGQTVWLTSEGLVFDLLRVKGGADPAKLDTARDLLSNSPLPRVGEEGMG